jgi:hypothetical protein
MWFVVGVCVYPCVCLSGESYCCEANRLSANQEITLLSLLFIMLKNKNKTRRSFKYRVIKKGGLNFVHIDIQN